MHSCPVFSILSSAGQLGSGCLFVKGFLDDAKSAPEDIRTLHTEMEILSAEAGRILTLFRNANSSPQMTEGCEAALKQCVDAVAKLGEKIEKDVKRFGRDGTGKWWGRTKAATRKKSISEELVRVERARTQLTMVMRGISVNVERDHDWTLEAGLTKACTQGETIVARTSRADQATTDIKEQGKTIINWTNRTDERLASINNHHNTTGAWTTRADETSADINNQGNMMISWTNRADETTNSIRSQIEEMKLSIDELPQSSALETMMERTMSKVLKSHTDELHQQFESKANTPRIVEEDESETLPGQHNAQARSYPSSISECESQTITRRGMTVHNTAFRSRFFDFSITTTEVQYKNSRDTLDWEQASTRSKLVTKCNFQIRNLGFMYKSGNPATFYEQGICRSFRTYIIVPYRAPIMEACRTLDYFEVRRLFEAGLASPFDQDGYGASLAGCVAFGLWVRHNIQDFGKEKAATAVSLLKFLINCGGSDVGPVPHLTAALFSSNISRRALKTEFLDQSAEACTVTSDAYLRISI